jgi:hypothetical protein
MMLTDILLNRFFCGEEYLHKARFVSASIQRGDDNKAYKTSIINVSYMSVYILSIELEVNYKSLNHKFHTANAAPVPSESTTCSANMPT